MKQKSEMLTPLARDLRKRSTDAEKTLWQQLRGRRLDGFKFRRQVVIEPYIVDFVCLDMKLIVELDGGQHLDQSLEDQQRTAALEAMGYRVVRFWNHDVLKHTDAVVVEIYRQLT